MKTKKEIFEYIQNSTNWKIVPNNITVNVPLYLKAGYELWSAKIQDVCVVFASAKDETIDIRVHQNAIKRLDELTSCHTVLVFDKLDSRSIDSLIKKHISFVIKDKQIYMPFALLQIQTQNKKKTPFREVSLTSDADMILIGYLDNQIHSSMMIKEIAQVIGRELRATSQALNVLEALGYVQIEASGRSRYIHFISPIEVYDRLKEVAKSPVKYSFFAKGFMGEKVYSGFTALSNYSTLIEQKIKTVAISYKQLTSKQLEALECDEDEAEYKIEIWDREPSVFAHKDTINPLYVIRFFKNDEDERVQEAVEHLETKITEKLRDRDERD
jgi:DNA-binding transcriptional ArsR family regulator